MGSNRENQSARDGTQQSQSQTGGQQTGGASGQQTGDGPPDSSGLVNWFTETFLRAAVAILGLLLLLVALGQIAGVDMIGALGDLLATEVFQWVLVAVFALLLIVAASKSWNIRTSN